MSVVLVLPPILVPKTKEEPMGDEMSDDTSSTELSPSSHTDSINPFSAQIAVKLEAIPGNVEVLSEPVIFPQNVGKENSDNLYERYFYL